ncbi:MAG: asparagine synthase (glutamine-hydrolyzing) [Bacteroidales bacterium]
MCGIAGYFSNMEFNAAADLRRAADSMIHRGPDSGDFYFASHLGLAHRRLSIIDTSSDANQPFFSRDGRFVVVFNGEIYNFRELKAEFNIKTRTASDTEILIELFVLFGESFVNKLNGMFAIAVYDILEERLYLYRDRLGIKPLYYFSNNGIFIFASEIKALKCFDLVRDALSVNSNSVCDYLNLGFIPEPFTLFEQVRQLESGHYAVIDANGFRLHEYWNLDAAVHSTTLKDETIAIEELKRLMHSSVSYRLICDVPFGVFLSGGIDSSLVTAVAREIYPGKLKTFSIGFSESTHDESHYAAKVAQYLGTEHHQFRVSDQEAIDLTDQSVELFDQPFADSSALPTLLVSKLAAKEVKMVLTGDGGDELFMGYGAYQWAKRLNSPLVYKFRKPLAKLLNEGSSRYKRISELLNYQSDDNLQRHIFSQEQYLFAQAELNRILNPGFLEDYKERVFGYNGIRNLSKAEEQAFFDLRVYLKDDLLVKVDRASMAASLECRIPLLDYRLVEWALNLDDSLKIKGKSTKYLLKKLLFTYIPEELFHRPKWGFAVPMSAWLRGPLLPMMMDCLSEESITATGILNKKYVNELIVKFNSGKFDYLYNRLWSLIVLLKIMGKK